EAVEEDGEEVIHGGTTEEEEEEDGAETTTEVDISALPTTIGHGECGGRTAIGEGSDGGGDLHCYRDFLADKTESKMKPS
ncbi:hypothetical protein PMAYCL1PPCAC_17438, partial [Pristionchus mayeri]